MTQLKLTMEFEGKKAEVRIDKDRWSSHPMAGTVPPARMRAALRRIGAPCVSETKNNAKEVWEYHGGYFVSFEAA